MATFALARALGIAAALIALLELVIYLSGVPAWFEAALAGVPPLMAVLLFYLPGPILGLAAFTAWTRLDVPDRRTQRWVLVSAAAAMFVPMVVPLLFAGAGLIRAALGR